MMCRMKLAVIGAGPAGFFMAGEALKRWAECEVHLFERRVVPYGLVRFGVAPDHPLTRRTARMFDQIADHERFHFCGNVEVGRDISLEDLRATHHAVVICTGAEQPHLPLQAGSGLPGIAHALDFSRWMNGEPDGFSGNLLERVHTALVIGNGNVALDAARMLARPAADWVSTDIPPPVMEALIHHRVHRVVIAGRRGPAEASFSEAELEELLQLPGWEVRSDLPLPYGLKADKPPSARAIDFHFHHRVDGFTGGERVSGARFVHALSGATVEIPCQLVLFATGQRGVPLEGLPFDRERGIIPNQRGAIEGQEGLYVCGWIKRGAKGLIGHNRKDAIETFACMHEDAGKLSRRELRSIDWADVLARRGKTLVTWSDWKRLDILERERGAAVGRPRMNFSREEALSRLGFCA